MMRLLLFIFAFLISVAASSQSDGFVPYRRSSLYSVLVSHPDKKMNTEIVNAYLQLKTPDKYNNHDLADKYFTTYNRGRDDIFEEANDFLYSNEVAKGLVSKWFNRSPQMGWFDPELIMYRGQYNASELDILAAMQGKRGMAAIQDAGYELIGNTFVLVNDITYIDKEQNAQVAKGILSIIGAVAGVVAQENSDTTRINTAEIIALAAGAGAVISDLIAGFTVKITTYLYQLEWNDYIAGMFYDNYYLSKPTDSLSLAAYLEDPAVLVKKRGYEEDRALFSLKYIGSFKAKSSKTVLRGLNEPADVFRKVCARAIDNNIVELQKRYDQFKVKVPLYSTDPITANIGMKEGVSAKSKYEVLLPIVDEETGLTKYKREGIIKPVSGKIWDNRYMANEEEAVGATLGVTTFRKVRGGEFHKGMLIKEVK